MIGKDLMPIIESAHLSALREVRRVEEGIASGTIGNPDTARRIALRQLASSTTRLRQVSGEEGIERAWMMFAKVKNEPGSVSE